MTLDRRDLGATLLTALVVAAFAASHEAWDVWLIGGSHRWAAGLILGLGLATCGLGRGWPAQASALYAVLGSGAMVAGIVALTTGSLTALSLLVAADVLLWAVTTWRHTAGRVDYVPDNSRRRADGLTH